MTLEAPPRSPDQEDLQALIEEARQRARWRRRRYAIALLLAVMSAAALYVLLARSGGGATRTTGNAHAAGLGPQAFRRGQFWYTRTISLQHQWVPAGGTIEWRPGYFRPRGPEVLFDLRTSQETWVGIDGTIRERAVVAGVRFASGADRARWAAYGRPVPSFNHVWLGWKSHDAITVGGDRFPPAPRYQGGEWLGPSGWDVGDSLFNYRQLLLLPTQPTALRIRLNRAEAALARRDNRAGRDLAGAPTGAYSELSDIASLLAAPVSASERLALFRAAVTLPGASVNRHARDALGRPGVAVSASAGLASGRLIFDPRTGALLEEAPHASTVARGVVASPYALPRGVSPIRAPGAPAAAQTPGRSPAVGDPTTVFKVTLAAAAGPRPRRPPALDWVLLGSPRARCFAGFASGLAPLVASASMRSAGRLTWVYRLGPSGVHRQTWCAGRYELTVVPNYSRRPQASSPSPNLWPGLGSSVYFQVRSRAAGR